jgi:DNA-binding beta-propeller fold protein YncE
MVDPNNRPGGPNLIVTAKSANKVHFFDAATLAMTADLDMPGSTHEMAMSADGRTIYASIYGGGIFGRNQDPDRRIAVIDLASRSLMRTIDLGAIFAPHGIMIDQTGTVWSSGELGHAVLAIDPDTGQLDRIDVGATAHWVAVSHQLGKVFASCKQKEIVVIDRARRKPIDRIAVPSVTEGLAVTPDGETLYVCAQQQAAFYAIDARTHALRRVIAIDGADGGVPQMRRVRVSPDNRYVVVSSNKDAHAAIYDGDGLRQIASFSTKRSPMGFGFAADGMRAYLCCHDDAEVFEFELATGRIARTFPTAAGCEFIVAYA